jgi:signal transduction histidine kinase
MKATAKAGTLEWIVMAMSLYFAGLWFWAGAGLGSLRLLGASFVFGAGLWLGIRAVRALRRAEERDLRRVIDALEGAALTPEQLYFRHTRMLAEATVHLRTPKPSFRQIIETYSAGAERPRRQRARFLAALGHELRNPLNSVTGFSDMLLGGTDGELNPEQLRSVSTIRSSAERLLRLVGAVVDQARLEVGTLHLQPQWVDPEELVAEALAFVRSRAEGAQVRGDATGGLPRVFVDRSRTIHALASLAVLVIRSSEGEMTMRVAPPRRDQVGSGFVQFDLVTDLADASADTLAVVQKLERQSPAADALGLEVSLARRIIEAQGGRIWSEAGTPGRLRVCMTLPTSPP